MNSYIKKYYLILLIITAVFFPVNRSWSGMAVMDTPSYGYMVEQLKKAQDQINLAKSQIDKVKGVQTRIEGLQKKITGSYNRAKGLHKKVKAIREKFDDKPEGLIERAKYLKNVGKEAKGLKGSFKSIEKEGGDRYMEARKILDEDFIDPRRVKDRKKKQALTFKRYAVKQRAYKESLIQADEVLGTMPNKFINLEKLSTEIDATDNLKDSQDLSNRFLAEILSVLNQLLQVTGHMSETVAMANYMGVSEDTSNVIAKGGSEGTASTQSAIEAHLLAEGFDPKNATNDEVEDLMFGQ